MENNDLPSLKTNTHGVSNLQFHDLKIPNVLRGQMHLSPNCSDLESVITALSLEILSSTDVLLSQFERRGTSQLPLSWPAMQTKLSLCASIMYACMYAKLGRHFGWLLGSWLKIFTTSFLFCYYPDSLSSKCSIFIWRVCTWSISMYVCIGIYFCSSLPSLGKLLLGVSCSKMKFRKKSNEIKKLHSKFIIVIIGSHSGKYLSMCLSPIEIIKT